jgi:hypothetical protein
MRQMAHMEHTEDGTHGTHRVLVEKPEGKRPFGVDGGIILKTNFYKTG